MTHRSLTRQRAAAFTVPELLIAAGIFGVVSTVLFSILQASSVLLAKNWGINMTHNVARMGSERLFSLVQTSIAAPILVDASLNPIAGNGPAAGITFMRMATSSTYTNVNTVTASGNSLKLRRSDTQTMPAPRAGDLVVMIGTDRDTFASPYIVGFQGTIASVSPINSTDYTTTLSGTAGSFSNPTVASGTVLTADSPVFLISKLACVAKGNELRLMNNAATPTTYEVLAQLVAKTSENQLLPFRYTTSDKRWVDVDLRVQSTNYTNRKLDTTNTFFDLKESLAYRSAIIVQNSN